MKTKSLWMAMAALAIAGCSQNEVTEINPDANRTIGLDVYTGVQTRGAETTTTTIKGSGNGSDAGFGILAYQTGNAGWNSEKASTAPDFMYNEHATWTTGSPGSWSYENTPRFWPTNGDKLTFFVYAPYESAPSAGTNQNITLSGQSEHNAPKITFEVKTSNSWKDMVDLVTDARTAIQDQTSSSNSGTVSFKFSHVLTQIANVKVKPDVELGNHTKIFVTGLKLDPGNSKLYDKAVYDFGTNEWEAASPASYFSGVQDLSAFLNRTTASQWGYTENSIDVSDKNTAAALFPTSQALYFIPVDNGTGTAAAGDLKLKISYDIVTRVDDSNYLKSTVTDKEVILPINTFKKGTKHTYVLTIKMNAIKISVEDDMTAWTDGRDSNVDVQ